MAEKLMDLEHNAGINRFIKLAYMTLSSTGRIALQRLESTYREMECSMNEYVNSDEFDMTAFAYVSQRLPLSVFKCSTILFGQSESILEENGIPLSSWEEVYAKARRRRYLYDGKETLIAFLSSKSDLDDVVPSLIALQLEWNKAHNLLRKLKSRSVLKKEDVMKVLSLTERGWVNLKGTFGDELYDIIRTMMDRPCDIYVQNYEASYCRYRKETEKWWAHIATSAPGLEEKPVYFVSSNTHSIINLLSGFAESIEDEILSFAEGEPDLQEVVDVYRETEESLRKDNILYYLLMKAENGAEGRAIKERRREYEKSVGIYRIASRRTLDVPAEVIDLKRLYEHTKDIRTGMKIPPEIVESGAMLLNIDYPLGRTAYFILTKIAEHVEKILGVYVIGKAASLFADRGDILIPSFIFDQHTRNRYFIDNRISSKDVIPYMDLSRHGVYDRQKAVTVLGTFLQNREMLNDLLLSGISDLEMEAGPYLSAIYEILNPKRYPENESVGAATDGLDVGIIHYVSDNPLSAHKLDSSLATDGIDATYAASRAVLSKIFESICRRQC